MPRNTSLSVHRSEFPSCHWTLWGGGRLTDRRGEVPKGLEDDDRQTMTNNNMINLNTVHDCHHFRHEPFCSIMAEPNRKELTGVFPLRWGEWSH